MVHLRDTFGYDEGGGLSEKVRRRPYSVVLFDEIEKAHPDVMNMLLQILDDGRLTDSHGRAVSFKNTVVIMTSNVGARLITEKKTLGFSESIDNQYENTKKEVMGELKREFKPEFINRIDEIIVFQKLKEDEIMKILDIMIKGVCKKLEEQDISLEISKSAKELVVKKGTDSNYGARPLRRAVQTVLEDRLAEEILEGNLKSGDTAKVNAKDGEILVKVMVKS